jgi:hypothetical protein
MERDADAGCVILRTRSAVVCALSLALAVSLPASAGAFSGAYVRGERFPTGWKAQALLIRVACPPRTQSTPRPGDFSFCRGTIVVHRDGRVVASAPFSVRTYDSHVEKVRVRRGARRLFRPYRRVRLTWRARSHDGQGQWAANSGTITLFNPYNRL